ncbi:hypothetical protein Tco_0389888 [Tanacetum coccineum]
MMMYMVMAKEAKVQVKKVKGSTRLSPAAPQAIQPPGRIKKQSRRKQRKETEVPQDETHHDDSVPIPSNDLVLSGKGYSSKGDCWFKEEGLKVGKEKEIKNYRVTKIKEKMFDIDDLHDDEVIVDMVVGEKQEKSAKINEREVSTGVEDSDAPTILVATADEGVSAAKIDEITPTNAPTTVIDELTLAQTIIEIKAAKPKAVTIAATTTTTRPKARGVTKDKGKAIMIEPEVPLKRKDQVALDEEMARNLEAQLQAKLIEEENTQAMMEADTLLAKRLQTREQEELTDEEKAKVFMEFIERRRKHFAVLREQEKINKPPTKAQKRNQMFVYLKHMGGYKHNQLKGRSYDEIHKVFDKEIKRVNSFVAMNSEAQEISGKKDESSSKKTKIAQDSSAKRAGDKLESDESKKQKTDENEEVEEDNEAELKMHMVIVKDDDIAVDVIPLATKPPVIVEYKIIKEGIIGHYQLIRADGSSKRYSSMIRMLQGIDREDLETLWKLVKTKHGDTSPEDEHERVLCGDLKVMFEPDIKSDVWRNLQGYKVTIWKLYDSCGVHFVRFGNVHIFMLVEKRYPLTPITITNMLNKKLQADYWNEMCYQLLKLMFRGGLLGLKDFKMILRVTAAQESIKDWDQHTLSIDVSRLCCEVGTLKGLCTEFIHNISKLEANLENARNNLDVKGLRKRFLRKIPNSFVRSVEASRRRKMFSLLKTLAYAALNYVLSLGDLGDWKIWKIMNLRLENFMTRFSTIDMGDPHLAVHGQNCLIRKMSLVTAYLACFVFYYPLKNKIFVARNAEFFENSLKLQEASGRNVDLELIQEDDIQPS